MDGLLDEENGMLKPGNATRKLSKEQVQEIRENYGKGVTQGALSRHFGVSIGQIGRIVRGESWQEGAGNRMPTQAEADAILMRLLERQAQVNSIPELVMDRKPPPMLLDGGDAADETSGAGLTAIQERAAAMGVDIDRLIKKEST